MDYEKMSMDELTTKEASEALMCALWLNNPEHEKYAREAAAKVLAIHQEILKRITAEQDEK